MSLFGKKSAAVPVGPQKRAAAGTLFFNREGDLLLLQPIDHDYWKLVGGVIESHESPRVTCVRMAKLELGIDVPEPKFLGVAYKSDPVPGNESIVFYFYGGTLSEETIKTFSIAKDQLRDARFFGFEDAKAVSPGTEKTLGYCLETLKTEKPFYLER